MVVLEQNYHHHHHHHRATKTKKVPLPPVVVVSAPARCRPPSAASISDKVSAAVRVMSLAFHKITAAAAERGNKLVGRSLDELILRHNTALGCSSSDVRTSFVSPREVEFSCTSSPPRRPRRRHRRAGHSSAAAWAHIDSDRRRLLRRQNYWGAAAMEPEPGRAGLAEAEEGEFHVDKAAEEFIEKFYRELMMQKWAAARGQDSDRYA